MKKLIKVKWFEKFPTQVGSYWFYGWAYEGEEDTRKPGWNYVTVRKISNGVMHTCNSHFWFEKEKGHGMFCKINFPEKPF